LPGIQPGARSASFHLQLAKRSCFSTTHLLFLEDRPFAIRFFGLGSVSGKEQGASWKGLGAERRGKKPNEGDVLLPQ
jgi:hypothetical protein